MRLPLTVRDVAAIALCGLAAGCGQSSPPDARLADPPKAAHAVAAPTPRAFELSADLRPLASVQDDAPCADSAAYTESSTSSAIAPRIREISATPDSTARSLIREPGALPAEVYEPAPLAEGAERPRNSYVPLAMPRIDAPAPGMQPQLAATPAFNRFEDSQSVPAIAAISSAAKTPQVEPYQLTTVSRPAMPKSPAAFAAESIHSSQPASPVPAPSPSSAPAPTANAPNIQAVTSQVQQISAQAHVMAQRGMLFSARADLLKGLQLIAQELDAGQGGTIHASALTAGLTALDEASEFQSLQTQPANASNVATIASRHRTPVLGGEHAAPGSAVAAQQQYLAYAQSQLAVAAGGLPVASQTLYQLGRLHTGLSTTPSDPEALHIPRAMVYHQAALATDPTNHLAANELGVLLARCGQLAEARTLLLQSVSIRPLAEAWHNLAVVHRRLGESDLAKRAEHERDLASREAGRQSAARDPGVQWVDARSFARSAGQTPGQDKAEHDLAAAASAQRR